MPSGLQPEGPHEYPSPLVRVALERKSKEGSSRQVVRMPKGELFRVKDIFTQEAYKLADFRGSRQPRTIVDIGANVGLFAIYIKMKDPDAVIHCYEPVASTVALLTENVARLPGVHIHPYALGKDTGQGTMYLHHSNTGQNSFKKIDRHDAYRGSVVVPCRNAGQVMDELRLNRIDVIKIDTEGCEIEILESLGDWIERVDYFLVEFHSEQDRRRLDSTLANFLLYAGRISTIGRGILKYVNRRLISGVIG